VKRDGKDEQDTTAVTSTTKKKKKQGHSLKKKKKGTAFLIPFNYGPVTTLHIEMGPSHLATHLARNIASHCSLYTPRKRKPQRRKNAA